jgi:membrane glycosyltransferase
MTTWKGLHWRVGREDVFIANRAVIHKAFLSACMLQKRTGHASITSHAMEVVNTQSLSKSAQITVRAMVDNPGEHLLH